MKKSLILLLLMSCVLACKKNKHLVISDLEGSINGRFMPAAAIIKIVAIGKLPGKSYEININLGLGNFSQGKIPPGEYVLNFSVEDSFLPVDPVNVTVKGGENLDLGMFTANAKPVVAAKGSISGKLEPVMPMMWVTASAVDGLHSYSTYVNYSTGRFDLQDVVSGNYALSFRRSDHPLNIDVETTVAIGKNSDVGTLAVPIKDFDYSISCNVDGKFAGWDLKSSYLCDTFQMPYMGSRSTYVSIVLKGVSGPGTYVCNKTSGNKISYQVYEQSRIVAASVRVSYESTEFGEAESKVIITSVNPETRTIKGTFSGVLTAESGNSAKSRVITDGVINTKY